MPRAALAITFALLLGGCANLAYYAQAVGGQMQVMLAARPIPEILRDPATTPELRQQLEHTRAIREFASRELALPNNGSYRSYADLGRPYVVWNVFAAGEFSVHLQEWCLLVVGCVNYRGYYDRNEAERFARELEQQGQETYVANVPAYSTLGFFDDPVLNTFLRFGEQEVARIVFHELAHQLVFIPDDSTFNESFATTVEIEGMRRWLAKAGNSSAQRSFETWQDRKAQFQELVADYRKRLVSLYASSLSDPEKRRAKAATMTELRQAYAKLKSGWGESRSGYDDFFGQNLNNAKLGSVSLYASLVPAFQTLLAQADYDLPRFYQRAAALARLNRDERRAALEHLIPVIQPARLPIVVTAGR